jgi:alpha-1,3-rhamnosyl/mannosyltransferase
VAGTAVSAAGREPLRLGYDARCLTVARRPVRTGVEYYAHHLLQGLARRDLRLTVFTAPGADLGVDGASQVGVRGAESSLAWPLALGGAVRGRRLDVLLVPEQYLPVGPGLPPSVAVVHDVHFLAHPHSYGRLSRLKLTVATRQVVAGARRVAVVSESVEAELLERFPRLEGRLAVVSPACDPELFRPRPAAEVRATLERLAAPRPYLLYVGALAPHKNVGAVLRLAARHSDLGVVVAGPDKGAEAGLRGLAAELGLGARARFLGYVDDRDKADLMAGAELFVFPSRHEGFGLPVLEAMACGTPVLCSDRGSLPEVLGDGGLAVPPDDAEALAAAAATLLDSTERVRAGRRALARSRAYSWPESAARMHRLALEAAG